MKDVSSHERNVICNAKDRFHVRAFLQQVMLQLQSKITLDSTSKNTMLCLVQLSK